jgi:hypothetical protein
MDNDATATPTYNSILVDNVEFIEAAPDLALTTLTPNVGVTNNEIVVKCITFLLWQFLTYRFLIK